MVNQLLINKVNNYFKTLKSQKLVVKPSIPILYFGDEVAYRQSDCRVITVGKNPSLNEFFNPIINNFDIKYRFPSWMIINNLIQVWDEYFKKEPLKSWFSSFEPILNGLNCSFYPNAQYLNTALHTDICSPIATRPTWSKLQPHQQEQLFILNIPIWWDLVEDLKPDIILFSIPQQLFKDNINNTLGQTLHKVTHKANGSKRKKPYIVYWQNKVINNKSTKIIFGQASQKPFGHISDTEKIKIGRKI